MGQIIIKNAVKREKGFFYYVDKEGNLCKQDISKNVGRKKKGEDL